MVEHSEHEASAWLRAHVVPELNEGVHGGEEARAAPGRARDMRGAGAWRGAAHSLTYCARGPGCESHRRGVRQGA